MGIMHRSEPGAILSVNRQNNENQISYCQSCLKIKVLSPLKARVYLDENGKVKSPDADFDKFRQCWTCGLIVPVYEIKQEAELNSLAEPRDNPFNSGNKVLAVGEIRKYDRTGKTQRKRLFKQDLSQYKEEDVKDALRKGAKLVSYVEN